jgi:DNA uptake protein ComE-like DNA-binding protein
MNIRQLGLYAAFAAGLALPASAQTTQTSPVKPSPSMTTPKPTTGAQPGSSARAALIDINSASEADLDALPGVGKSRASAIIKNRPYKGKDDLLSRHILPANVYNGIKDKIIARQG